MQRPARRRFITRSGSVALARLFVSHGLATPRCPDTRALLATHPPQ